MYKPCILGTNVLVRIFFLDYENILLHQLTSVNFGAATACKLFSCNVTNNYTKTCLKFSVVQYPINPPREVCMIVRASFIKQNLCTNYETL